MRRHRFFLLLIIPFIFTFPSCHKKSTSSIKTYEIALDPSWYALGNTQESGNILGFSTELLQIIGEDQHIAFSLLYTSWDSLLPGLNSMKYQGALTSLLPYSFYQPQYEFSELYLATGPVLVLPSSSPYHSLQDIVNKPVAVLSGSSAILLLEAYPNILISSCQSIAELINQMRSQQVVGALLPLLIARSYTEGSMKADFTIASPPLNTEGLRLIIKRGTNPSLIKNFNTGLKQIQSDGRHQALLSEWKLG